jgi:hypothetical protein
MFKDTKSDDMVWASHEVGSPWQKTLDSKGLYKKIDPELALNCSKKSISSEQYRKFAEEEAEFRKMVDG